MSMYRQEFVVIKMNLQILGCRAIGHCLGSDRYETFSWQWAVYQPGSGTSETVQKRPFPQTWLGCQFAGYFFLLYWADEYRYPTMSRQKLHDLLAQLKQQRHCVDLIDSEYQQRLDEIVESLEQQKLYPDAFDQYSGLNQQIKGLMVDYEAAHPTISNLLSSLQQLLHNFKS